MAKILKYNIRHTTTYQYEENIDACVMSVCMQPRDHRRQVVQSFFIQTAPQATFSVEFDAFGNRHHYFDIHHRHDRLDITVHAVIEHSFDESHFDKSELPKDAWSKLIALKNDWDMWEFLRPTALTTVSPPLTAWIDSSEVNRETNPYKRLKRLTELMFDSFEYLPGSTHVDSTIDHFLDNRKGVCQDYAHFMLAVAKSWGIPARYVSGYLYDVSEQAPRAENATHAWVECWLPNLGWIPFDPTNNQLDDTNLVTVAIGRDYRDVAPSRGIAIGGASSDLEVGVTVKRELTETQTIVAQQQAQQ
ncbi:MAG: transglutaminase family protein [Gammaproteobacteria bacterium]|nr:transglutaminase family protein [Gammaproteobacteria bacterium]